MSAYPDTVYNARRAKNWRHRVAQMGTDSVLADADPLRPILHELHTRMSWTAVALLLGVGRRYVTQVAEGDVKRVNHYFDHKVRTSAGASLTTGKQYVNATPTRRRLQALMAIGYTMQALSREIGYSRGPLEDVVRERVTEVYADTHGKVANAYERLAMKIPSATTTQQRGHMTRVKREATAKGWPPPLAWDDIDDLTEAPSLKEGPGGWQRAPVDHAIVQRFLDGEHSIRTSTADKSEIARRWVESGRSLSELGRVAGWKPDRYLVLSQEGAA